MSKRSFTQDVMSVLTSRVLAKACQFLIGVVTARLIGPEGRGLIASLTVAPDLALTFSQLGVRQSVAYFVGKKVHETAEIVPTLLGLVLISNFTAIIACLIYYHFTGLTAQPWLLLTLALAPIPFSLLTNYASGVFLGKQMIVRFNRVNWIPMALNLALVIAIGWAANLGIIGIMIAAVAAAVVSSAYAIYLLSRVVPLRIGFNRAIASKLTRLGMVYATALFMLTLNYRLPILLLQNLSSFSEVGVYAVGQALAFIIWEIPAVLSNLIFSRGVNSTDGNAFGDKVVVLARVVILAGIAIAIACAIVGPMAIPLIYGKEFAGSATVLTILLPGTVAFMAFKILHMDIAGRGRPWVSMPVVVPCMILNVVFSTALIPKYGAYGAAAMTSGSYVVASLIYVIVYARITGRTIASIVVYRRSDFAAALQRLPFRRT
jgi:O-antigen/teichoic acid export membrane protein